MALDIQFLRQARLDRGVTLRHLAEGLGVSPSFLTLIEKGRRRAKSELLERYSELLESAERATLTTPTQVNPIVDRVLTLLAGFSPRQRPDLEKTVFESRKFFREDATIPAVLPDRDLMIFYQKILSAAKNGRSQLVGPDDRVTLIWNSLQDYKMHGDKLISTIASLCGLGNSNFRFLFVPSSSSSNAVDETIWLLKQQLDYVYYKSQISFDAVPDLKFGLFPIDFFVVHEKLADIRFSSALFNKKCGLLVDDCGETNLSALTSYITKIETYQERRVLLFRGQADHLSFLNAYMRTENANGPRLLAQPFLGSQLRPPEHYNKDTEWWTRYSNHRDRFNKQMDVQRLADDRKEAHAMVKQRMTNFPVRQICSRTMVEKWALENERLDIDQSRIREPRDDRIARIDYVLFLLENYEKFNIGLLEDKDGRQFGWNTRNIEWLVQGRDKVVFELLIENDFPSTDNESAIEKEHNRLRRELGLNSLSVQLIVHSEPIAQAFAQHFDSVWSKIKKDSVDNRAVYEYFITLRSRMQSLPA
jgi:transcriptional regulator with XRE-family HTH domain